ncbi:MAG: ATP-binding protein [Sphaerochaeta sp.]
MGTDLTVAVLSGKGGTGKTLLSVNLAAVAQKATYIDCDVEEPNGHLFFKPTILSEHVVSIPKPVVDQSLCDGCRICTEACAFNALALIGKELLIFNEVCHSCGLCTTLCPRKALTEVAQPLGVIRRGNHGTVTFEDGILDIGQSEAVPLIKALLRESHKDLVVIDSPPGSGCLVTEAISGADFCLLVAEPTRFGAHNLAMVHELVQILGKPCAVLLNKTVEGTENPSEEYARSHGLSIMGSLPYDRTLATLTSEGLIASEQSEDYHFFFSGLLDSIRKEAADASDTHPQR